MRRRDFMTGIAGSAFASPLVARAQQPAMPVIGFLSSVSAGAFTAMLDGFKKGLSEGGYDEGRNVTIEYRWAEGRYDRLPALAADLVERRVALIAANTAAAPVAKAATASIPIVFTTGEDPVRNGLVASLSRPGGNLTGVVSLNAEIGPKRIQLLKEVKPAATAFALLVNPGNPLTETLKRDTQAAGKKLGVAVHVLSAGSERELEPAFANATDLRVDGLVIGPDAFFASAAHRSLARLTVRHALPAISPYPSFSRAGGLMSYGGSNTETARLMGLYAARILRGESPAELPVQQSTKVELTINLITAKKLGITFPLALLGRADEVIE